LLLERLSALAERPGIHLLCEVRPKELGGLTATIRDLRSQLYAPWQLTVVAPFPRPAEYEDVAFLEWIETRENVNDAAAAVLRARADWVAAIKPGDRLEPHWLATAVLYSAMRPEWQLIYWDEDRIDESGMRFAPIFKPDFNLDLLRSMPYQGDSILVRRTALDPWPEARLLGPAAAYNLSLSVLDRCGEAAVGHIAEVLYHRSVQMEHRVSAEAEERAGMRALRAHLRRNRIDAAVQQGFLPRTCRVTYSMPEKPSVSIIIPTRDRLHLLAPCVESLLQKTDYPNYELIIVDNNSEETEALAYLESLPHGSSGQVRVLRYPHPFNYSAINNFAAREAKGEFLLLLNNDTQIIQEQWLERMLVHGMRPDVGVVGARLIFPDGRLQHAGVIVGLSGMADHPHLGLPVKAPGYMGRAQVDQDFSAVTAACLLIRKSLFLDLGGFDEERFPVLFNDVDLCLKARQRRLKIVWTPYATVVHHGSVTQNSEKISRKKAERVLGEQSAMVERWIGSMAEDPAYNRNLSLADTDFGIENRVDAPWDANFRDRPRIMGYAADHAGCGNYRIYAPLRALQRSGRAQCFVLEAQTEGKLPCAWEIARAAPETLIVQSALHEEDLQQLKGLRWAGNIFKIFELDDLKTKVPQASVHAQVIPKDVGHRLERALSMCDRLIVATEPLKEAHRKLIGDIVVVPNYLESERWKGLQPAQRQGPRPRVGWAGSVSHSGDLALLQRVMGELAGEADFVLFGMCPAALRPYVREFHPAVPFDAYPARLASLGLDLAIAPLELNAFNEAKSNLRILEYGILGWPVVCTDIQPYRNAPVRCVRNRPEEWVEAIREHLHDLRATKEAGTKLRRWVLDHWMLENHLDEWMAALGGESVGRARDSERAAIASA
jgi:GT2 family glycosyltransferase